MFSSLVAIAIAGPLISTASSAPLFDDPEDIILNASCLWGSRVCAGNAAFGSCNFSPCAGQLCVNVPSGTCSFSIPFSCPPFPQVFCPIYLNQGFTVNNLACDAYCQPVGFTGACGCACSGKIISGSTAWTQTICR